jgi:hypothetical protein
MPLDPEVLAEIQKRLGEAGPLGPDAETAARYQNAAPNGQYDSLPANDTIRERAQALQDSEAARDYDRYLESLTTGDFKDREPYFPAAPEKIDQPDDKVSSYAVVPAQYRDPSSAKADPDVVAAIQKKYGFGPGQDADALRAAQELAGKNRMNAGIWGGVATAANAAAGNQKPADLQPFQEMAKSADQPVQDVLQQRQATMQNEKLKSEQELNDPNSPKSKALKDTIKRLYPGQFSDEDLAGVTAADMELIFKPLQLKEQIEARKQVAADNLKMRQTMLQQQQHEKQYTHQVNAQHALNQDQEYKDSIKDLDEAQKLDRQADDALSNPRSAAQLPIQVARTMTNRINERELQASGGSQAILDQASRLSNKMASGTIDDTDYKQLKQWIGVMKQSAAATKQNAESRYVTQYSRANQTNPDQARFDLGLSQQPEARTTNQTKPQPGSVIMYRGKRYRVGTDGDSLEPM